MFVEVFPFCFFNEDMAIKNYMKTMTSFLYQELYLLARQYFPIKSCENHVNSET